MSKGQVTKEGQCTVHLTAMGTRSATKRATSVSDAMALIKALRGRGFAADLKGSKNEKGEFGLGGHQQKTAISPVKSLLNVQY